MKQPFYITTTLPYVNTKAHVGHALEFIRADTLARYKALTGFEVFLNTGADEHGVKIYQKAKEEGRDVQEYVDEYAKHLEDLTIKLGMARDVDGITFNFTRTTNKEHTEAAKKFWNICKENGYIEKRKYKGLYCVSDELFIPEKDLVNGRCPNHPDKDLEEVEEENYFFKASAFSEELVDLYENNPDFIFPKERLNEMKSLVEKGLEDFSISRLAEKMPWGIPVPYDPEQVMYVWFDALVNYINVIGWPDDLDSFNKWWPVTQYCGKDNTRQQAAMWQSMLMAANLPPSRRIVVNGFVTSGGVKMSKSLGNIVDPLELIDEFGIDALRYYVLREVNPFEDSDLTKKRFLEVYNANLVNGLGNLVSRVMKMSEDFGVSYTNEQITEVIEAEREDVFSVDSKYREGAEEYRFNDAMDAVFKVVQETDEFIQKEEPFKVIKENKEKALQDVFTCVHSVIKISQMLLPMMPETSEKIVQAVLENKKPEEPIFPRK
ncbi:MAG: methionine--tRNA ligase [Candidatus Pacebacteria bacterium]|nr:methionine--tRNA ligase [Candidatus Paceibacterota bacterium]